MNIVYFLIPISIGLAGGMLFLFLVANRNGQFDDMEGPAMRVLAEPSEFEGSARVTVANEESQQVRRDNKSAENS